MALNTLNFNKGKTQVLIIGPCDAPRMDLEPYVKPTGKNLGVTMDSDFKLDNRQKLSCQI